MPKVVKWFGDVLEVLMGPKLPLMKVLEASYINLYIKKIRLQGNISGMDFQPGYAVAIRVSDTEYRNYTVAFNDVEKGIVEIIVHLHNDAPGTRFMNDLSIGREIRMSMPRGKKMYNTLQTTHILFGDETSLGLAYAFQHILFIAQPSFHFYFELDEVNEKIPHLLGLKNYTIVPKNEIFQNESLLEKMEIFQLENWQKSTFILTGNARSMQMIRSNIQKKKIEGKILAQAYWADGKIGL
jgi:NADPH-dependent ferric siderophore reductase